MYYVTDNPIKLLKQSLLSKFVSYYCLHITKNIAYHIAEVLIFYADKLVVTGSSKTLHVFNFTSFTEVIKI